MSYCNVDDVKGALYRPLLTQMTAQLGDKVTEDIQNHINHADNYVDAVLCAKFSVPFSTVPKVVKTISTMMATYFATAQFSEKEELTEDRLQTAKDMLNALLESGKLPDDGSQGSTDDGTTGTRTMQGGSDSQVFTKSVLDEW